VGRAVNNKILLLEIYKEAVGNNEEVRRELGIKTSNMGCSKQVVRAIM